MVCSVASSLAAGWFVSLATGATVISASPASPPDAAAGAAPPAATLEPSEPMAVGPEAAAGAV